MATSGGPTFADALARGSPEPVLSVTPSGRVLTWTRRAERAFGYTRPEAIGRQLLTLIVPPEGIDEAQRAITEALTTGSSRCASLRRHKGGALLPAVPMRLVRRGEGPAASVVFLAGRDAAEARIVEVRGHDGAPDPSPSLPPHARDALWEEAGDVLSNSYAVSPMLQRLVDTLVPRFADWATADLIDVSGPRRVGAAHRDDALAAFLRELGPGGEDADPPLSTLRVLRNARAALRTEAPDGPPATEALARLGDGAFLALPLVGRTRMFGALTIVRVASREEGSQALFSDAEVSWARELARRASLEVENITLLDHAQTLGAATRHAGERAKLLTTLSSALSEALTPVQVTEEAVRLAHETLGASGGAISMLSTDHASFEVTALVGDAQPLSNATLRFPIHAALPLADAARSGDPVVLETTLAGAPRYPFLATTRREHGALAAVPLLVDGRNVGALGLVFPQRRSFSHEDLDFIRSLARHAADALERARLYGAERSARAQADAEARRSAFLSDASRILASSFDYRATLEAAARLCVPMFGDWCAVHLRERDGSIRPVAVVHSDPRKVALAREFMWRRSQPNDDVGGVAQVFQTGRPEIFDDLPDAALARLYADAQTRDLLRSLGIRSQVILPLVARGRVLGALALCNATPRRLAPHDLQLVEELTRRAALAVDNARLYHEVEEAYRRKEESMAALRESEERYRLLVDGAPDYALFLLDPQGRIQSWNLAAQRMLGYTAEEVIGHKTDRFYPPEDLAAGVPAEELRVAREHDRCEQESWRIRKDGTRYWASVVVTTLRDDKGNVRGFSKLHRDITERKLAREELDLARQRVAQHEKLSTMGTLVSGVAHEIRTPLTAIANSVHLIRLLAGRGGATPDVLERHTDVALEGVERINLLVQDLRRFKRLDAGGRSVTSLHEVVSEALNLFRAAHRGRIEVTSTLSPTPVCEVDRSQLQQVVLNLLQNASEAMPHGGRVELATGSADDGSALLRVRDTGQGMTPEIRARMFEEFFTTKAEGTGLGLSIVRRIIEMHHGSIDCESEPGQGTTFTIRLPAQD